MTAQFPLAARPRLLVLWDVDHTLIETRGVGRAIYERAFPAATGTPLAALASIAGRTELAIMRESLRINKVAPTELMVQKLAAALVQGYEDAREELRTLGRALPGAEVILRGLAGNAGVFQSVLTGNLRDVARIKLAVFGLDRYLDLEAGAYGEDNSERVKLVVIAQERARTRAGTDFGNDATVLVGDTPNDVAAGRVAGVRVIGVATGKTTRDELEAAGATQAANDLYECQMVLDQWIAQLA